MFYFYKIYKEKGDEEQDSEEIQKIIKFYKTQNSKESCMDFKEDMCEFIIISPNVDDKLSIDFENDLDSPINPLKSDKKLDSPLKLDKKLDTSPKKILNSPKKNSECLAMSLPKEFIISTNPFNRNRSESISPSPKNGKLNSNEKIRYLDDEEIKNDSSDSSDSGSDDDINIEKNNNNVVKEDPIMEEIESEESSEENNEILIKYKVKFPYSKAKNQEIWNLVKNLAIINSKDDVRCENSYKNGGQICPDPETVKNIRNIGKELIKEIGRKIISGSFNLTTISFPIKSMIPKSALETIFQGSRTIIISFFL